MPRIPPSTPNTQPHAASKPHTTSGLNSASSIHKPDTLHHTHSTAANPQILTLPLTPRATAARFRTLLTAHEIKEIHEYKDIWFAGAASAVKVASAERRTGAHMAACNIPGTFSDPLSQNSAGTLQYNFGFDDSRGDLYLTANDHIAYRYEILGLLGKGSFG